MILRYSAEDANGGGPVSLVCVHGLSGSSRWWARVVAPLERSGPVVAIDLPRSLRPSEIAAG